MALRLAVGMGVLLVVKMPAQGFAELGVSVTLSGPACGGVAGGMFRGSAGVLTHGSDFVFRCLPISLRVSMIGVRRRGSRRR